LLPLTRNECICGKDGVRFIDAMNLSTSKGFPLSGAKRDSVIETNTIDEEGNLQRYVEIPQEIWDQVALMEEQLANGERCYALFKACPKDEPTKLTKDKVRIFQAADWATQILMRKYYLPVAHCLSMFPVQSECAVGVNAHGKEWDELARHMFKHGKDRILAGDYGKYDLRMPAQLILAAFKVCIEFARLSGNYTERDLCVMQGLATEICYCCTSYNGDVVVHTGSHPSGQNMTVYINCIVNSLLMRSAFYALRPEGCESRFRDTVAVMTYGDDLKGSVKEGHDWFNHITYAKFLADHDMELTMPDKESDPVPYMKDHEADFLKRHNIYCPHTRMYHGALGEESIFKSLHCVLESKHVSERQQVMDNIDGALREFWFHGEALYEKRREQLKQVASHFEMELCIPGLNRSYRDVLKDYCEKHEIEFSDTAEQAAV